nr:hypothetical protein [Agrobacterium fabrum]
MSQGASTIRAIFRPEEMARAERSVLLRLENISKEFPGVKALSNVHFDLRSGEVHAVCGENGAGKIDT